MKQSTLLLIGGGGHCKSCIDVIESEGKYFIAGILDLKEKIGQKILNYKIIASDNDLDSLLKIYDVCFISLGYIKNPQIRISIYNNLILKKAIVPTIVSPRAVVSFYSQIKCGTIIMHNAIISSEVIISENCIINTGAIVEHETLIGFNSHISTSAIINGQCRIGNNCFIGSNSVVCNNINICNDVVIGAGSVVNKNICKSGIYAGNPARRIK